MVERTGSLKFVPVKTRRRKIDGERLKQAAAETPDAYLSEYARQFGCSAPAVFYAFKRLNITYKKTFTCREKPEEKRQEFLSRIAGIPAEKQVYADESGIRQALQRDYGRAVRGIRVEDTKSGQAFERLNIIGAYCDGETVAECCCRGTATKEYFELRFGGYLAVNVSKGSWIILDNASFHSKTNLKKIAGDAGLDLLFLPPYSPDLNPIEKARANMKRGLRDLIPRYGNLATAVYRYFGYDIP